MSERLERAYQLARLSHSKDDCEILLKEAQRENSVGFYIMAIALMEPSENIWSAMYTYLKKYEAHDDLKNLFDLILENMEHWDRFSFKKVTIQKGIVPLDIKLLHKVDSLELLYNVDYLNNDFITRITPHLANIKSLSLIASPKVLKDTSDFAASCPNLEFLKVSIRTNRYTSSEAAHFHVPPQIIQFSIDMENQDIEIDFTDNTKLQYLEINSPTKLNSIAHTPVTLDSLAIDNRTLNIDLSAIPPNLKNLTITKLLPPGYDYSKLEGFIFRGSPHIGSKDHKAVISVMDSLNALKVFIAPNFIFIDGGLRYLLGRNKGTLESIFVNTHLYSLNGWSCNTLQDLYLKLFPDVPEEFELTVPNVRNVFVVCQKSEVIVSLLTSLEIPIIFLSIETGSISKELRLLILKNYSTSLQVLELNIRNTVDFESGVQEIIESDLATVVKLVVEFKYEEDNLYGMLPGFSKTTNTPKKEQYLDNLHEKIKKSLSKCWRTIMVIVNDEVITKDIL